MLLWYIHILCIVHVSALILPRWHRSFGTESPRLCAVQPVVETPIARRRGFLGKIALMTGILIATGIGTLMNVTQTSVKMSRNRLSVSQTS